MIGTPYLCRPCHAYVGCHPGSIVALGTVANAELRSWRQAAHVAFDLLWKGPDATMGRTQAYRCLAQRLGTKPEHTHIAMFDEELCSRTIGLFSSMAA